MVLAWDPLTDQQGMVVISSVLLLAHGQVQLEVLRTIVAEVLPPAYCSVHGHLVQAVVQVAHPEDLVGEVVMVAYPGPFSVSVEQISAL